MGLSTKISSVLSDLKEHGLLDKYPDLEEVVKLGHQRLETLRQKPVKHRQRHDLTKTMESCKEALLEDLRNFK